MHVKACNIHVTCTVFPAGLVNGIVHALINNTFYAVNNGNGPASFSGLLASPPKKLYFPSAHKLHEGRKEMGLGSRCHLPLWLTLWPTDNGFRSSQSATSHDISNLVGKIIIIVTGMYVIATVCRVKWWDY